MKTVYPLLTLLSASFVAAAPAPFVVTGDTGVANANLGRREKATTHGFGRQALRLRSEFIAARGNQENADAADAAGKVAQGQEGAAAAEEEHQAKGKGNGKGANAAAAAAGKVAQGQEGAAAAEQEQQAKGKGKGKGAAAAEEEHQAKGKGNGKGVNAAAAAADEVEQGQEGAAAAEEEQQGNGKGANAAAAAADEVAQGQEGAAAAEEEQQAKGKGNGKGADSNAGAEQAAKGQAAADPKVAEEQVQEDQQAQLEHEQAMQNAAQAEQAQLEHEQAMQDAAQAEQAQLEHEQAMQNAAQAEEGAAAGNATGIVDNNGAANVTDGIAVNATENAGQAKGKGNGAKGEGKNNGNNAKGKGKDNQDLLQQADAALKAGGKEQKQGGAGLLESLGLGNLLGGGAGAADAKAGQANGLAGGIDLSAFGIGRNKKRTVTSFRA